jgi:four helix bundle protein
MATVKKFEDLEIWKLSRELSLNISPFFINMERSHDFGLKDQINRSAGSIMDNIAEGFERDGRREFIQFLSMSKGSCGELKSQLYRALDRNYIDESQFNSTVEQCNILSNKIGSFINYLKGTGISGSKFRNANENANAKPETRNAKPETT